MDVNDVLQNISKRRQRDTELTDIDKPIQLDVGNLTAWDPDSVLLPKSGKDREAYFKKLARDGVQVVLNQLYALDTELIEGERLLKLPEPTTVLPRGKPVPKPKAPTRWEQFAKNKGIKSKSSKNREKSVWDDATQKWVPRYGYNKVKNDEEKNWVIEVPDNADPNVDYFAKRREEKKERTAKNKFQQLRNVARAQG